MTVYDLRISNPWLVANLLKVQLILSLATMLLPVYLALDKPFFDIRPLKPKVFSHFNERDRPLSGLPVDPSFIYLK